MLRWPSLAACNDSHFWKSTSTSGSGQIWNTKFRHPPKKNKITRIFLKSAQVRSIFFGGPFGDDDLRVTWRSWMQHHMKTMSLKKTHRLQIVMGYLWKSDKSMLNPQGFMVPSDATIETNGYGSECWILQRMRIKHGQKRHCPINKLYKVPSNYKLVNESFQMNSKCRSL